MVVYAVVMSALGLYASIVHREMGSLGGVAAGLLVLGLMFVSLKNPRAGYIPALLVGICLAVMFFNKFLGPKGQAYPHLVIALLNVALIVCLLGGHMLSMAAKKRQEA